MDRGDKIVKILTILNYIDMSAFAIVTVWLYGMRGVRISTAAKMLLFLICMTVIVTLVFIKVDTEFEVKAFVLTSTLCTTALALFDAYISGWPYMFVIFQVIFLVCNLAGLRKYVFMVMMIVDSFIILIMTIWLNMFGVIECFVVITSILLTCWIAFIFANKMTKMNKMIATQNQSRDDLLALVESRFIEERFANSAKSNFLANMSHEIRTPINAILGLNTMTLRESKDAQICEYATEIEQAGQTLLALINDILDISKVESGKLEIVPVEYDLASVINDTINMISFKAKAKNLEIKVDVDKDLPSRLYGDDIRIRQILMNLLSNAVKYTDEGYITLRVTGSVCAEEAILRFYVSDTGIGIKEEDMKKLFEKYERLDTMKNRNIEGTGLGIAISTRILELMGSKLDVTSVYGKGSTFSFEIEQKIINKEPIGNFSRRFDKTKSEESNDVRFIAPDAKLLIVDDNKINRLVFKKLLQRIKVQVEEADSGQACLDMCCRNEYDIIFLDHMMPGMDGLETRKRMKENVACPNKNTPVVALTANAISGSRQFYLDAGFDDYISKPIEPKKLENVIFELLPEEMKEIFSGVSGQTDIVNKSEG